MKLQDDKIQEKTKITILTGFLGSGKTTFINNILKFPQLKTKIAVIQNDFTNDALGIQTSMMTDGDGNIIDDFFQMPNGRICCTVKYELIHCLIINRDDLVATIDTLLQKKNNIEHIIIQTNGLADPSAVIQTFWLDQELQTKIKLHKTTGVLDCNNFQKNLQNCELKQLLMKQLIFADQILLNKIVSDAYKYCLQDTCDKETVDGIQNMIQQINPYQSFKRTSYSKIEIDEMLSKPSIPVFPKVSKQLQSQGHLHATQIYDFYAFMVAQVVDIKKFQSRVANLLWEEAGKSQYQILRMKGIITTSQSKQYLLQSVGDTFEIKLIQGETSKINDGKTQSKLLVIGKNIQKNAEKIAEFLKL